jgi:hypothetical protein
VSFQVQAGKAHAPWLERVARWRGRVNGPAPASREIPVGAIKRSATDSAALIGAGVPSALAARHEAVLADAIGDATAIAFAAKQLGVADTRAFTDAMKRFYNALGQQLELAEPMRANELAERTVRAVRCLVEENGTRADLVPMIVSVAALMDACARRASQLGWREAGHVEVGEMAAATVAELIERFGAAPGLGAALAAHANLSEQVDLVKEPKGYAEQAQSWASVTNLLVRAAPREAFSMSIGARLADLLADAIEKGAPDPLASAVEKSLESTAARRDPLLARLRADASPLALALAQIVEASPAGPESLFAAVESAAGSPNPHLASWLQPLVGSPAAAPLIEHLVALDPQRICGPDFAASLLELAGLPAGALTGLREPWRSYVALCAGTDRGLLSALADEARELGSGRTLPSLVKFADRYRKAEAAVADHEELGPKRQSMVAPLAHLGVDDPEPLLAMLGEAKKVLPLADVASVLGAQPGIEAFFDPKNRYRSDPLPYLKDFLEAARTDAPDDRAGQTDLFRTAIQLADCVAQISINPERQMDRLRADWRLSLAHPEKLLPSATVRTLLAAGNWSLSKFVAAHPKLPPELALTCAVHLSAAQVAWVEDRLERVGKSRAGVRACRDLVYGLVEAERLDLIGAIASSASSRPAINEAIKRIAIAFRQDEMAHAPLDLIKAGLEAGRDPIADLEAGSKAGTLHGVDLLQLTRGRASEQGAKNISRAAKQLNHYLHLYKSGGSNADGFDQAFLRPKLLSAIRAEAEGTYPDIKYRGAASQQLLSFLSPSEREYFKKRTVTYAEGTSAPPDLGACLESLQKIGRAMADSIDLGGGPRGPFTWDAESLRIATELRDGLILEFRDLENGDPDRPNVSRSLSILRDVVAMLELHQGLASMPSDPTIAVLGLRPLLERALPALTEHGGPAFAEAARAILRDTEGLGAAPGGGKYAVDDDSFLAMVESAQSGCFSTAWAAGGRHWAMAGMLLDSNVRALRVMEGDQQRWRSYLKVFYGELDGYRGPILWLDYPQPDGGGSEQDLDLLYRHAINKANALGYPITIGEDNVAYGAHGHTPEYDARNRLGAVGQSMGLAIREYTPVEFRFYPGNTGYLHSDTLFENGAGRIDEWRGVAPYWERTVNTRAIVMPSQLRGAP